MPLQDCAACRGRAAGDAVRIPASLARARRPARSLPTAPGADAVVVLAVRIRELGAAPAELVLDLLLRVGQLASDLLVTRVASGAHARRRATRSRRHARRARASRPRSSSRADCGSSPASSEIVERRAVARIAAADEDLSPGRPSRSSAGNTLAALRNASSKRRAYAAKTPEQPHLRTSRSGWIDSRCSQVGETAW